MIQLALKSRFSLGVAATVLALSCFGCGGSGAAVGDGDTAGLADADTQSDAAAEPEVDSGPPCEAETRDFCAPCTCDDQCGPGGRCGELPTGERVCGGACSVNESEADCGPGTFCAAYGSTTSEFSCQPAGLTCEMTGVQCSRCETNDDCEAGFVCHESTVTKALSCYQRCADNAECPAPLVCHEDFSICVPILGDRARDQCDTGTRLLCEPCASNFDCKAGFQCRDGICSEACESFGGTESTCAEGMFCVGGFCEPPVELGGCTVWLSCAAANICKSGEECDRGVCRRPCSAGCAIFETCVAGYCEQP
jgi:hypothetical protein